LTIDERIEALEAAVTSRGSPGTQIVRVLKADTGVQWSLGIGGISLPKTFFQGPSIENVVAQGEAAVAAMTGARLATAWDELDSVLFDAAAEVVGADARDSRTEAVVPG
jgi:hypothetical protein